MRKENDLEVEHQNSYAPDKVIEDPQCDTRPKEWFKLAVPYLDMAEMGVVALVLESRAKKQRCTWGN